MSGAGQQLADLPLKEQLRRGFKDMGTRSFSSAKNFGLVGAIFAGTECCIEGVCLDCTKNGMLWLIQANLSTGQRTTSPME